MKVIIIDDEPLARSIVKEYLADYSEIEIVAECNDGFEGLKAIQELNPDLLFLDIQMPKITGFEMLELLENAPSIIFTTAYEEFALKAFNIHAIDYLLKPFTKDRFKQALDKLEERKRFSKSKVDSFLNTLHQNENQPQRVVVKMHNKIKVIPFTEIIFIEAAEDYVFIHTEEGKFLKHKTMIFFENTLDKNIFVRCHRSFIVDVQQITKLELYEKESYTAILKSGNKIPVSKNGYQKLKLILGI